MAEATLAVLYNQRAGAVDRIFSLLRRREFPVAGITIERTHLPEIGRMTVLVSQPDAVTQMTRHLNRLVDVVAVERGQDDAVRREYTLARVRCSPQQRPEVLSILAVYQAEALSVTADYMVVEASGSGSDLDSLLSALSSYGIEDLARTSPLAVSRTSAKTQAGS
jgi:acetolactate synthase-1/3 small subunit